MPYCKATYRSFHTSEDDDESYQRVDEVTELDSFEAVVSYLQGIYDRNATEAADANALTSEDEREDLSGFGGFTSDLENSFGSVVEFALSRRFALMIRHKPEPLAIPRRECAESGRYIDFWLGYSNHTQFAENELLSRDEGLQYLRRWLDSNEFPDNPV